MDEPGIDGGQSAVGNVDIPDWMLKRRARLQTQPANSEGSDVTGKVDDSAAAETQQVPSLSAKPTTVSTSSARSKASAPVASTQAALKSQLPASEPVDLSLIPLDPESDQLAAAPQVVPPKLPVRPGKPAKKVVIPVIKPEDTPRLGWWEEFKLEHLNKEALRGYGLSLGVHLVIGIILSLVVIHNQAKKDGTGLLATTGLGEGAGGELDGTGIFQIEPAGGKAEQSLDTMLNSESVTSAVGASALMDADNGVAGLMGAKGTGGTGGSGEGEGGQIGDAAGIGGFQMPAGGKGVVQKGSFTAWTVPEDPGPGEDYKIIIQVRYKNPKQKMPKGDVSGTVTGTDDYRLMISPSTSRIIPEAHQVVVQVPGASARVKDTIKVNSAILREHQQLVIVF